MHLQSTYILMDASVIIQVSSKTVNSNIHPILNIYSVTDDILPRLAYKNPLKLIHAHTSTDK